MTELLEKELTGFVLPSTIGPYRKQITVTNASVEYLGHLDHKPRTDSLGKAQDFLTIDKQAHDQARERVQQMAAHPPLVWKEPMATYPPVVGKEPIKDPEKKYHIYKITLKFDAYPFGVLKDVETRLQGMTVWEKRMDVDDATVHVLYTYSHP